MLRAKLTIAGSNFIFGHINENYSEYLSREKKLRVIYRGINIDYFNPKEHISLKKRKTQTRMGYNFKSVHNSFTRKTDLLERTREIY